MNDLIAENEKLRSELARLEENFTARMHRVEMHNSRLANLYAASYLLHKSADRDSVLSIIQEIVINLVGSEQVAVFERAADGEFVVAASFGVDPAHVMPFRVDGEPIARCISTGQVYVNPNAGAPSEDLTAFIPLQIDGILVGAILVLRLLDHKTSLQEIDHELFDLLAVHAASALYCAILREKVSPVH